MGASARTRGAARGGCAAFGGVATLPSFYPTCSPLRGGARVRAAGFLRVPPGPPALPARRTGLSPASLGRSQSSGCGPCGGAAGDNVPAAGLSLRRPTPSVAGTHFRRDPLSRSCSAGGARWASVCLGVGHRLSRPPQSQGGLEMGGELPSHPCVPSAARNPLWRDPTTTPRGRGFVTPLDGGGN